MKIARYIGDLLFEYECIVIPGFGGFITKEIPAKIHPVQNHFIPPSKDIVFNVHLKANDGLLINHIARSEKITYSEAKSRLEKFVLRCESALESGKRIHFRKVGNLFLNKYGHKQFEPDSSQNYQADSYGLKSFISPPIKRSIGGRPIKKQVNQDRKAEEVHAKTTSPMAKKKKADGPRYVQINLSAILILIVLTALIIFKFGMVKNYYNNYSSLIPFYYSSPNNYLIENYEKLGVEKLYNFKFDIKNVGDKLNINYELPTDEEKTIKVDEIEDQKPEAKIVDNTKNQAEPVITETKDIPTDEEPTETKEEVVTKTPETEILTESKDSAPQFYIIAGVFQSLANADKFVLQLKQKGFKADIIGTNKYDQYRVFFESYKGMNDASRQLAIIRKEENPDAWIFSL